MLSFDFYKNENFYFEKKIVLSLQMSYSENARSKITIFSQRLDILNRTAY